MHALILYSRFWITIYAMFSKDGFMLIWGKYLNDFELFKMIFTINSISGYNDFK